MKFRNARTMFSYSLCAFFKVAYYRIFQCHVIFFPKKTSFRIVLFDLISFFLIDVNGIAQRPKGDNGSHQSSGNMDDRRPGNVEVQRPVSNFVKKSPILAPPSKERAMKAGEESAPMTDTNVEYELHKLDEMKLSELKELAKTKGAKGYSKLKKGELLEMLRGILQSSS